MVKKTGGCAGLILAGGEGRRVGGADKGLLGFRGRPLIAHVIERLAPQVETLLISANRNLDLYGRFGYPVLADASPLHLGPLAGIAAGLRACRLPWLCCVPCDGPWLPLDLVERLMMGKGSAPVAIPLTSEGIQPAFMLCRREGLQPLEEALAAGERKVRAWCQAQAAAEVDFPEAQAFANLNTLKALEALDTCQNALGQANQ